MNLFGLSGIFTFIALSSLFITILIHDYRSRLNQTFALFITAVAFWGFGVYQISQIATVPEAFLWWRIAHIGVILIPVTFLHFVHVFLNIKSKLAVYASYAIGLVFLALDATPYFISNVRWVFDSFYYDSPPGIAYVLFVAFFTALVLYGHYLLYGEMRKSEGNRRRQIFLVFLAGAVAFPAGSTAYLPVFGIDLHPAPGTLMISFYAAVIFYAITRYGLFNAKIIVTEFLTVTTWALFFIRIFLAEGLGNRFVDAGVMFIAVVLGTFAIRSALKEAEQKEQLEDLTKNLQQKVDEQTKEIKKAYEVEKKARQELEELDKAKDQFILTTQHHLRTPLTIIKGYLDVLKNLPSLPGEATSAVNKIDSHTDDLSKFISDLLQVTELRVVKKDETDDN